MMQLPGMVKKRGSSAAMQQIWAHENESQQQRTVTTSSSSTTEDQKNACNDSSEIHADAIDSESSIEDSPSFSTIDEVDIEDQNDMNSETAQLLIPLQRRNTTVISNTSLPSMIDKTFLSTTMFESNHSTSKYIQNHHKGAVMNVCNTGNNMNGCNTKHASPPSSATVKGSSTSVPGNILPLFRHPSPQPIKDVQPTSRPHSTTITTASNNTAQTKVVQLLIGAAGIYATYLYYGVVQEDLFRYRSSSGDGFSYVWALQVLESAVTMIIGYMGRKLCGGRKNLPLLPFFHSGISQLAAKALMSLSLAAGLSFPVVVLAKSAKIVPVMIGQLLLGGSKYSFHDYLFAVMIVAGTSLLSAGNTSEHVASGSDTLTGLVLITLSLTADGFTGGLQKKLKRVTASMAPTTYDFLFYSHVAQFCAAIVVCCVTGEMYTAPSYLINNPTIWWWIGASCVCSAIGQCFIFYVISCFDPVVCTTITTTRKMLTVMFSIGFKGHDLSSWGYVGLGLAVSALLLEVEAKYAQYQLRQKGMVEVKASPATSSHPPTVTPSTSTLSIPQMSSNLSA
jgi:solute carrier family 35 (UDP-galactose transporter), member B1